MSRCVIDGFRSSAEGRSSPRDFNITSSPQALCVNAQRCPHGAQAAKRPERVGGLGEGITQCRRSSSPPRRQARPPGHFARRRV